MINQIGALWLGVELKAVKKNQKASRAKGWRRKPVVTNPQALLCPYLMQNRNGAGGWVKECETSEY